MEKVIDAAMRVHMKIGPGLLESVYETLLTTELLRRGLHVERQKIAVFGYEGITFAEGLRLDLLVNEPVTIELKSVESLSTATSPRIQGVLPTTKSLSRFLRASRPLRSSA